MNRTDGSWSGVFLRLAVAATALSLWAYIPYRYAVRPPRLEGVLGTTYAILFPIAALLALGALLVVWRPAWLERLGGGTRAVVGLYAGAWLLMGLFCIPSLSALAAKAPLKGLVSMIHMTGQHAFLGLTAAFAAWRPQAVTAILEGRPVTEAHASVATRLTEPT